MTRGAWNGWRNDAGVLAAVSVPGSVYHSDRPFYLVAGLVEEMISRGAPGAANLAETVAAQVRRWNVLLASRRLLKQIRG